jgi:subtilase family serine protease
VLLVALFCWAASPAIADGTPSAGGPILLTIGAVPHLPTGATRIGPLAPSRSITIGVALAVRNPAVLAEAASAAAADPAGAVRLTPQQFAATYGATEAAVRRVTSTLRALGLHPGALSSNHLVIPVTATTGRIERAFGARLDGVRLTNGSIGWTPETAPRLPASVAPEVSAVLGLSNLIPPHDQIPSAAQIGSSSRPPDAKPATAAPPRRVRARRTTP